MSNKEQPKPLLCDGCSKAVNPADSKAVVLKNALGNNHHFHGFECVVKWAQKER